MSVSDLVGQLTAMTPPIKRVSGAALVDRVKRLTWLDIAALAAMLVFLLSLLLAQGPHDTFARSEAVIVEFPSAQRALDGLSPSSAEKGELQLLGYPLLLAAVTRIAGGNMFAAAKVLSSVCAVLFGTFAYLLIRRVFDARLALLSALVSMSLGGVLFVSCATGQETLFAFLAAASVFCAAKEPWPGPTQAAASGLLAGLAFAVQPSGMLLLLVLALRLASIPRQGLNLRHRAITLGVALLSFALASAIVLVVGNGLSSDATVAQGSSTALSDATSESVGGSLQQWAWQIGHTMERLFAGLPEVVRSLGRYPETGTWFLSGPLWVLAIVGLPLAARGKDWRRIWLIASLGVAWVAAAIALADLPSYVIMVPVLAALAVQVFTDGFLPDVMLTREAGEPLILVPGSLLGALRRNHRGQAESEAPDGISLTLVLLIGLLTVSALVTSVRTRQAFALQREEDSYLQDITEYLRTSLGPGLRYPVGTSSESQARYWIPVGTGTPVAVIDSEEDFYAAIPELSHILYDGAVASLPDGSPMNSLANPALTEPYLEAVYYRPSSPKAILYRLLDYAQEASIEHVGVTSSSVDNPPSHVADGQESTSWMSEPQTSRDSRQSVILDLGEVQDINRIWILPRARGTAFPAEIAIDTSIDGHVWHQVVEPTGMTVPERQDPVTLSFESSSARFVRISAGLLRWDDDLRGYVASMAEIRIGSGKERPGQLAQFSLVTPGELEFDAVTHELVASVKNDGDVAGRAAVEFFKGWTVKDSEFLGKVMSTQIAPGVEGEVRLFFDGGDTLRSGHCRQVRIVLQAFGPGPTGLLLDTYGTELPEAQEVSAVVCSPETVALDNLDYPDSPLARGWSASSESAEGPQVSVLDDPELGKRIMKIEYRGDDASVVGLWVKIYDRPVLTFQVRAEETFTILLRVVTLGDERFYIQYSPETWDTSSEEYPVGKVVSFGLGRYVADGEWSKISRDVANDFWTRTGLQIDYVELFGIRTEGSLEVTDIKLSTSK